ncbi:MAG: hypothetical protein V7722_09970 [Porticoccus sp.]
MKFIPAPELRKSFSVFGHFYSIGLESGDRIDCRSVLEVVSKGMVGSEPGCLTRQLPDAIFIMMNPGSSESVDATDATIAGEDISGLNIFLVPAKPDPTQYQVMRLMHYCGWNHVRVLNISDMKDPISGKFMKRFSDLEKRTGYTGHSLFDDVRADELIDKLKRRSEAPVVCAWGVSKDLDPLIARCLGKISHLPLLTGLLKAHSNNKYFHPLPILQADKETWVNDMVDMLKV